MAVMVRIWPDLEPPTSDKDQFQIYKKRHVQI